MPYLIASDLPEAPAGARFRAALARPGILQLPGAHNGMAALQARAAGFQALYLSGAAMTASMGLPDLGIITVDEVAFFIRQIVRASGLPLLVDGDTGYGEALNVMHMVRVFEDAGAGAVHLEDQLLPKKCGHLNDKRLAAPADMAAKVEAGHQLMVKAARLKDKGERNDLEAGIAKYMAAEYCADVVEQSFRIHGGIGYTKEYEIERLYREAPMLLIGEGTAEIQKMIIGKSILKDYPARG